MKRLASSAVALTLALSPGMTHMSEADTQPRTPRTPRTPQPVEGAYRSLSPTPTPTATPAPTSQTQGNGGKPEISRSNPTTVEGRLTAAWPGDDAWVLRIAHCESRMTPTAVSHANAVGILQVHWPSWSGLARSMGYSYADMKRIEPNVDVAWQVYKRQGPSAWVCN